MSTHGKVVWYEGMFLRPQHFQQQDRYLERLIGDRCGHLRPYDWGILDLVLDQHALQEGKLAIQSCQGILPDGTPFSIPQQDDPPTPLLIDTNLRDSRILLALPAHKASGEIDRDEGSSTVARYRAFTQELRNNIVGCEDREESIKLGRRQFQLRVERNKSHGGYSVIRVAHVIEKRPDQRLVLDEDFIPPTLDCQSWSLLSRFVEEIQSLLKQCSQELADRVGVPEQEGRGGLEDLLMLQVVNRYNLLFIHLCHMQGLHPEIFYQIALQLAGELASLTRTPRLPLSFPLYDHDDLKNTFKPLLDELRVALRWRRIRPVVEILIKKFEGGKYLAQIPENQRTLFSEADFYLVVNVPEALRSTFPNQCTISAAEELMTLVKKIVPGIKLRPLAAAPPYIPFDKDFTYFELEQGSDYWERLKDSPHGLAFHVAGEFPGIVMRLWAIKEQRR